MAEKEYVSKNEAWSEGTLQDWYLNSIDNTIPPIWTEEHISELCSDFIVIPKDASAADVRPEKHGQWEEYDQDRDFYICSVCRAVEFMPEEEDLYKYCPNCGAKMDGKDGKDGEENA